MRPCVRSCVAPSLLPPGNDAPCALPLRGRPKQVKDALFASGEPGTELLAPLAVVVLGGLISSTVLNLVVLPAANAIVRR